MPSKGESDPKQKPEPTPAVEHVVGAHQLLQALQDRIGKHPELGEVNLDRYLGMYAWHGRHHVAHITALRQRMGWT